ncbi:MAG: MltA domain-containing protein [Burkholderiaceae bacterium]
MVHQTISTRSNSAPSASSRISSMRSFPWHLSVAVIVGMLAACAGGPPLSPPPAPRPPAAPPDAPVVLPSDTGPLPPALVQPKSRWIPVRWAELPGFAEDNPWEAWNAWIKSCERPGPVFAPLCAEVRRLSIATPEEQRAWMMSRLQPFRVEGHDGRVEGLLTGYYEPVLLARRTPGDGYTVPLYSPPASLNTRRPWYTRQEMETLPEVQAQLRGREILYLPDALAALDIQVQGSGQVRVIEPDGQTRLVRLAFAGHNGQTYASVGQWVMRQTGSGQGSWAAIRSWAAQNPNRISEMMWANPRVVFFREEAVPDSGSGPRGAQGVPLTPGRSIAVDRESIPYGTPVWMASSGPGATLQRLVMAQDTGGAILGAVRADYFAGGGPEAGELAGKLKQPLRLWVLWPK